MESLIYEYCFSFPEGLKKHFTLAVEESTLTMVPHPSMDRPEKWTTLSYNQCTCCPLHPSTSPRCPIALNLADLVSAFTAIASYESCQVTCTTAERVVSKDTNVQDGLSSIMGLIMATSGCPMMEILKPMARFHLPFATVEEAVFRSVSVYLLRQYFVHIDSGDSDFHLEKVKTHYRQIEEVNSGMLKRIQGASQLDADRNAIVILNCLAQFLYLEIDDNLRTLRPYFKSAPS